MTVTLNRDELSDLISIVDAEISRDKESLLYWQDICEDDIDYDSKSENVLLYNEDIRRCELIRSKLLRSL